MQHSQFCKRPCQASATRQVAAATKALLSSSAQTSRVNRVKTVKEVISGSLPLAKRNKFLNLINGKNKVLKVFVESARAVARSAIVAEDAWKLSKENGVQIIPADLPYLFRHDASPGETVMRRVMLSVQEFERDMVVHRLTHGLITKKATSRRINQVGKIKVNGAHSILGKLSPLFQNSEH